MKIYIHLLSKLPIKEDNLDNLYIKFTHALENMTQYTNSFTSFKNLIIVLILSTCSWILECARLFTVLYAFNVHISFLSIIIIFFLANLIAILSVLPGRDWIF